MWVASSLETDVQIPFHLGQGNMVFLAKLNVCLSFSHRAGSEYLSESRDRFKISLFAKFPKLLAVNVYKCNHCLLAGETVFFCKRAKGRKTNEIFFITKHLFSKYILCVCVCVCVPCCSASNGSFRELWLLPC